MSLSGVLFAGRLAYQLQSSASGCSNAGIIMSFFFYFSFLLLALTTKNRTGAGGSDGEGP